MKMDSEGFHDKAENILQVMLDFYSPYFTITQEYMLGNTKLNVLAEYHNQEEKNLYGMKLDKLGPEANEYGMYLIVEDFTPEVWEQAKNLIDVAERELVKLHPDHGSSILSLIILSGQAFDGAALQLKKYKLWKKYDHQGWLMARLAVINVHDRSILCNVDGKDLTNLIKKALAGKKIL